MSAPVPHSRLWLLLGAFALLGLFTMHGLGGHGLHRDSANVTGHDAVTSATDSMTSVEHDGVSASSDTCDGICASDAGVDVRTDPGAAMGGWALMLCLAVLAAGVAVLFLAARALIPDILRFVNGGTAHRWTPSRDHDPPCLFSLSVQRC